jgi:hypothetical protein
VLDNNLKMSGLFRIAILSIVMLLVACSAKETASSDIGVASNIASLSKLTPKESEPPRPPAQSSTGPEILAHTQLSDPEDTAPLSKRWEPPSDFTHEALSTALDYLAFIGVLPEMPDDSAETPDGSNDYGQQQIIGYSYEKRPIISYRFGHGLQTVLFIGGIHGGYEWNTILLAYQAIDYFLEHPELVPEDVTLIIIPSANPDGQFRATGKEGRFEMADLAYDTTSGRFNGRYVDLNRNWDCAWQPAAQWRNQAVSGGMKPFSEPESRALRDFLLHQKPEAVVFWHSTAGGVYGAGCQELFQPARQLATIYGEASGYPVADQFSYYPVTGDAGDWLSTQGIPSISVELASHDFVEWPDNLAGMLAVLDYHSQPALRSSELE